MIALEPTCANCARGILKENGRVACGAGFEEGPIWAIGYEQTVAPILALALFVPGAKVSLPEFARADDMKGSQRGCKIFSEQTPAGFILASPVTPPRREPPPDAIEEPICGACDTPIYGGYCRGCDLDETRIEIT